MSFKDGERVQINRKVLRVFDCFAGFGGAEFGLAKAGIEYESVGFSEIDKYAIHCFHQNHKGKNYGDITKINWSDVPDFDLLTGGFPCQDISQAGKQDLSKGRSVLVNELIRCLREKQPKYFLFENVGAIETKPFKEFLRQIENDLKNSGYVVFRKMLNTKDFGVPQNRERVWWIGYRKDIHSKPFGWMPYPQPETLKLKLKDILEESVDKKYFLKQEQVQRLVNHSESQKIKGNGFSQLSINVNKVCFTLNAYEHNDAKCIQLNNEKATSKGERVYSPEGITPTLCGNGGGLGAKTGLYLIDDRYKDKGRRYTEYCPTLNFHGDTVGGITTPKVVGCALRSWPRTGNTDKNRTQNLELNQGEFSNSITNVQKDSLVCEYGHSFEGFKGYENISVPIKSSEGSRNQVIIKNQNMVRRLTPKECFRLMGFLNDEINLDGLSDTQKYKLAGNGWDVNLVSKIFKSMEMV